MSKNNSSIALKAVSQYRSRDLISYLALRLYYLSDANQFDHWAEVVSTHLTLLKENHLLCKVKHFKAKPISSNFEYRDIDLPSPNEIISETLLLQKLSELDFFHSLNNVVFSYRLSRNYEIFEPYFIGFRERHVAVAKAAQEHLDDSGVVVYSDLRKFYPSITQYCALNAWSQTCEKEQLSESIRQLGIRLLQTHGEHMLTGPAFSHVIANLVLYDIDKELSAILPNGYFRYVDDIIFVGEKKIVEHAEDLFNKRIENLGCNINHDKRFLITTSQWLEGKNDFSEDNASKLWMKFIGGCRQTLLLKPNEAKVLSEKLHANGFRFNFLNYDNIIREKSYLSKILSFLGNPFIKNRICKNNAAELFSLAESLRDEYQHSFTELTKDYKAQCVDTIDTGYSDYNKKRFIHRYKKLLSKLIYLAQDKYIDDILSAIESIDDLRSYQAIFYAIKTKDVTYLVQFGTNIAYCASQVLHQYVPLSCSFQDWDIASCQAAAVMKIQGIDIEYAYPPQSCDCDFLKFANNDFAHIEANSYFKELAFMYGNEKKSFQDIINSAFDEFDDAVIDIERLLGGYY